MRKRNTLYTVNKHNMPLFMPEENLFKKGGLTNLATADKSANPWDYADDMDTGKQFLTLARTNPTGSALRSNYANSTNILGVSKADNPFSKMNIAGGLKSVAGTGIGKGIIGAVGGVAANALYNGISGDLSSGAGKAVSGLTNTVGGVVSQVNPVAGLAVQGLGAAIGGGINAAVGTYTDEAQKAKNNAGTAQLNNFVSNANTFDAVQGIQAVENVKDAHKSGFLNSDWADSRNAEQKRQREEAMAFAQNSVLNNVNNIAEDQLNDALANYTAFGGPIETIGSDMGAIEYGFMSDYLDNKKRQTEQKQKLTNTFMSTPSGLFADGGPLNLFYQQDTPLFAFGGDMQTNGGDFSSGLTHINAGGSHEESPYDGVQMGVDQNGVPNLVEEGEVVYNDYVYSNRIELDEEAKAAFHFPKKKDMTYAEAAKKLEKEIAERPNDPISQAGFKAQMEALAEHQERQKQEMEAERAKAAFEALSPEEQVAVMENAAQQEQAAQQAAMQQEAMAQQQAQPSPEEQAMMQQQMMGQPEAMPQEMMSAEEGYAYGGNLFDEGGYKGALAWLHKTFPNQKNIEGIAKVLAKRVKQSGYHGSDINNPTWDWEGAYNSMVGSSNKKLSSDNEKLFESLVADGMSRREAFAFAYPSKLGYPFKGDKYAKEHTAAREAAYKKLITDYKEPAKASNTISAAKQPTGMTQAEKEALRDRMARTQMRDSQTSSPQQANASAAQPEQRSEQTSKPQAANNSSASEKGINVGAFNIEHPWDKYGLPGAEQYVLGQYAGWDDLTDDQKRQRALDTINGLNSIQESYKNNIAPLIGKKRQVWNKEVDQHQIDYHTKTGNVGFRQVDDGNNPLLDIDLTKPVGHNTGDNPAGNWHDGFSGPQTEQRYFGATGDNVNGLVDTLRQMGIDFSPYADWTIGEGNSARQLYRASLMGTSATETAETPSGPMIFKPEETTQQSVAAQYGAPWAPENNPSTTSGAASDTSAVSSSDEAREIVPIHKNANLRYAGLFGPAVGLGMMATGIGKPDYSGLDAAVQSGGNVFLADYKPIGNYLTYRPMDIWFEQNRLNAQSRATDRAIQNTTSPSKMAGLLANSYNSQLASGDLYRKALEYNDAKRVQVGEFNRGTDMFNAQAYNQNQQFNASARNRAEQYKAGLAMSAAQQKLAADASWNNSLYGNVAGLFKGIGELGRENYQYNQMVDLLGSGALPGITEDKLVRAGLYKYAAEGGKIRRKKGKRGLTI